MKQVLSLLLAFTFMQVQTWALSGGPVYGGPNSSSNQAGVYSGVMREVEVRRGFDFNGLQLPDPLFPSAGNIGVYTVTVPVTGLSSGTTVLFINGTTFIGTIDGVADPDRGMFEGIIQATGSFDVVTVPAQPARVIDNPFPEPDITIPAVDEETETPIAQGQMEARIIEKLTTPQSGRANLSNGNAARMKGEATIDAFIFVDQTGAPVPIVTSKYDVVGFRQSTTPLP